jgi:hypothetical protein
MLNFLLGLTVGIILGLFFTAILSAGAIADERNDHMLRALRRHKDAEQNSLVLQS